jgi:phage terminase small subunit
MRLTVKQELFCQEYILDFNGTRAAIRAGYSKKTAAVIASENLRKPHIRQKMSEMVGVVLRELEISVKSVVNEIAAVAFVDLGELFDEKGNLKPLGELDARLRKTIQRIEVDQRPTAENQTTKVRLFDKLRALELLAKYLNLFESEAPPEPPTQVNIAQVI